MLSAVRVYIVRLLPFITPTPDNGAQPGSLWDRVLAQPTQIPLLGDALKDGKAMVTATAQLPRNMKRDGSSFVGYIANGTSCRYHVPLVFSNA
jgi:hypothetical protein